MITNSRVESELKASWTWAKHSEAFSHRSSLTLAVSLIFYNFWQIRGCFSYCNNGEYIRLPLYPQHLVKWRVSRGSDWGTTSLADVFEHPVHNQTLWRHTPSQQRLQQDGRDCSNHLDTAQLSTQATTPGPLTSHRTADKPFHRCRSSSHSALEGELGYCHPLGLLRVWEVRCSWGALLGVFDVNGSSSYINTFFKPFLWGVHNLCLLFSLREGFADAQATTVPWKRSQEEKDPEQQENRERWAGHDFKRAAGSEHNPIDFKMKTIFV